MPNTRSAMSMVTCSFAGHVIRERRKDGARDRLQDVLAARVRDLEMIATEAQATFS